jgi:hypothetical protein
MLKRPGRASREDMMAAERVHADTEHGEHVADPCADALAGLITGLDPTSNTFVTLTPDDDSLSWYASVSLLDDGVYEVERGDAGQHTREHATAADIRRIAQDLTDWLVSRE